MNTMYIPGVKAGLLTGLCVLLSVASASAVAANANVTVIDALVETGFNRYLGQPIVDLGSEFGLFGGSFLAEYNPAGEAPIALTPATALDAILATNIDRDFQAALFGQLPEEIDPTGENRPLKDSLLQVGPGVFLRDVVPAHLEAPPYTVTRSGTSDPITLGDWIAAEGRMRIRCHVDGTATIRGSFRELVPNGVYTVWHMFIGDQGPAVVPLGGVPNVFVPDEDGAARYARQLSACPTDAQSQTVAFLVAYHFDGAAYGGFPDAPLDGLYAGVVTGEHLIFPINVPVVLDP